MQSPLQKLPQLCVSLVLHHSNLDQLRACLVSLRESVVLAQSRELLGAVVVVLVDNSCEDAYARQLGVVVDDFQNTQLLTFEVLSAVQNLGFGHGHNLAMAASASDCHLVLNPDTQLMPETLSEGFELLAQHPGAVLLSPHAVGSDGKQEFLCKRYPSVLILLLRGYAPAPVRNLFQPALERYEMRRECSRGTVEEVSIASGCFMLLRSDAMRACSGFDEGFFLYFEDFDFSLRLQKHGQLLFAPQMKIVHHGGYAARKGVRHLRYFAASAMRFFRLHGWRWI